MEQRVTRERYPWWVKFTMIGASTRQRLWLFAWLSLPLGALAVLYGLFFSRTGLGSALIVIGGIGFVISAAMYVLTIRWIDGHGTWD